MTVSLLYLAVSVVGALFTVVALRPPRRPIGLVALTFFAAWLATELALVHLTWQIVATVIFIAFGALDHWVGWLGLAITVASWVGLASIVASAWHTDRVFETALDDAFGAGWRERANPGDTSPVKVGIEWARVFLPFHFKRKGVTRVRDLQYVDDGRRRHRLDVYRRPDAPPGAPVLLQIHGGGWMIGNKEQQGLPLMYHLAQRGWVCVAINYRLSPKATWPDHLVDCKLAIKWLREHIAEYGGDPNYIVVTGGSAGGHLTAMVGLSANDPEFQPGFEAVDTSVRAMVPFYGIYDWSDRFGIRGKNDPMLKALERRIVKAKRADAPDVFDRASPMHYISPAAPPALVVHGVLDTLAPVQEAREFVRMLREQSQKPVVYVELRGAHHAFEIFHSIRSLHTVTGVDAFLAWVVSVDPPAARAEGAAAARGTEMIDQTTTARTEP
ncbi:MAG: carboxylesterase family protein [Actinomycetia bacterium]|nr:carboxylesterase family protein [Actinomycetes bacterium]